MGGGNFLKGPGGLFTKLTYALDLSIGNFSNEIHSILLRLFSKKDLFKSLTSSVLDDDNCVTLAIVNPRAVLKALFGGIFRT